MVTIERKRKRTTSTTASRQPTKKFTCSQEWTVPPLTLGRNHFHFGGSTGDRPQCFLGTTTPRNENHADHAVIVLSCQGYDQGWGDRQGRILVVEQERPKTLLDTRLLSMPIASGRLVAMSPLVDHHKRPLSLSFHPKPNKVYQFCAIVGGGGYNQLHLEEVTLRKHVQSHHDASFDTVLQTCLDVMNRSSFLAVPLDLKRKIVSFLSPIDVIHLTSASKSLTAELAISQVATPLLGQKDENQQAYCTNSPHPSCFAIYIPKRANTLHSVLFQCAISLPDYGWWCLGPVTVSIVAQRPPQDARQIPLLPYEQGRLVAKRSIVFGNCKTPMTLNFFPKEDECYQVWLGRGGSFAPPTTLGLTLLENPRFRTIGYHENGNNKMSEEESFLTTYIGFPSTTPKAETARDLDLLSNGMGQSIHQLMRLHELRARRYHP